MLILQLPTVHQTYYEMTAMDKWSLIFESVAVAQIDIHLAREEPDQHTVRVTPRGLTYDNHSQDQNRVSAHGMKS
jgi:hypothetical protein